jgi:hypothetical protein
MDRGLSIRKTVVISYGLTFAFCLLGMLIAYMRTRYAVAFYLVIFGSMIVAAYKMGLVHEKVRVVSPKALGAVDAVMPSAISPQSTEVLEVRSPAPAVMQESAEIEAEQVSVAPGREE